MEDTKPPSNEGIMTGTTAFINKGYEHEIGTSKPPPLEVVPPERDTFINFGGLTDQDLREACYEYISEECCYGSTFIRDMTLVDINNGYIFEYKLETFGETRETKWTNTPYYGQMIDGPENGPPPSPWDIYFSYPKKFVRNRAHQEMPHTATVQECSTCSGEGRVKCSNCDGDGFNRCNWCDGYGRTSEDGSCISCNGRGKKACFSCGGRGRVTCSPCDGNGRLKNYLALIVSWTKHVNMYISDLRSIPRHLIRHLGSRKIIREEDTQVFPLTNIPDISVIEASSQFIKQHQTSFSEGRILAQRQALWAVPLTRSKYSWKRRQGEFYVYGFDKRVYFKNYPLQYGCCTCC